MTKTGIILTGARKFIGRQVLRELLARGLSVTCLVRPESDTTALRALGLPLIAGDLNEPNQLGELLEGYESLIHIPNLASMREMATLSCAYKRAQLRRVIFISSTGIFTQLPALTKPRRIAAEHVITNSGLNYTILRPTMVYGGPEDGNIARLLRLCRYCPVTPVFGSGEAKQQPVHVDDLAWAVAEVLSSARAQHRKYNLGGGQVLSYNALVRLSYRALGKRGVLVHLPSKPVAAAVRTAAGLGFRLPLREEQILRLEEDKVFDLSAARADFAFAPRSFEQGVYEEARLVV